MNPVPGGPLSGIRVFDATLLMVGPWCTMQLGALGADVVHIESPEFAAGRTSGRMGGGQRRPANGGRLRHPQTLPLASVGPTMHGTSIGYMAWNLNKRGIVLDFKSPDGMEFAYDLLKTCDVLVENMRPGVMDRLGLGYEQVREIKPDIVYCGISGWGERGPMSTLIGHDGTAQAASGWISINGADAEHWEHYRHVTQLDASTGNHAAQTIIAALLARERTGKGQRIEVSMLEAALSVQTARVAEYVATGTPPRPMRTAVPATVPDDSFQCLDLEWVALSAQTDAQWRALCEALELDELGADASLATNAGRVAARERITEELTTLLSTRPIDWWVRVLGEAGVPASRMMRFDELRYHPQVTENRFIAHIPSRHWGPLYAGGPPWHFSETPERVFEPPYPGDHDAEVRADVARDLARMANDGAPRSSNGTPGLSPERPLEALTVVDLSQGRGGPHASMLMADAGAQVIKVEPPEGDLLRRQGPPFIGEDAAAFVLLNRGKQGIAIDPASDDDGRLFGELLRKADVVIEDWRSEYSRALAFDYERLRAENPRAVCLSVTGWGDQGPWVDRPQAELTAQFAAEIPLSLGRIGEPPIRIGADIANAYSGIFGFQALCAALLHRERGGSGQQIFVSLFGSLLFMRGTLWMANSDPDSFYGRLDDNWNAPSLPRQSAFQCSDGLVTFNSRVTDDEQLQALLEKLGVDAASVGEVPEGVIMSPDVVGNPMQPPPLTPAARDFWQRLFADRDVISVCLATAMNGGATPLFDYDMLFHSPQAEAIQLFLPMEDPQRGQYHVVGAPWTFATSTKRTPTPAPVVDEHRAQIVSALGLSPVASA